MGFASCQPKVTTNEISESIDSVKYENVEKIKIKKDMAINTNKIFPRLKANYGHEMYKSDLGKKFMGNSEIKLDIPEKFIPINENIFEDIMMSFIADNGLSYVMLQNEFLELNPNLTIDSLKVLSLNNLISEIRDKIQMHGDVNDVAMITCGGNFEAASILVPKTWENLFSHFGPKIAFCVPANDILYVCKADNKDAILKMKMQINEWFHSEDTQGLISKGIYLKEDGVKGAKLIDASF